MDDSLIVLLLIGIPVIIFNIIGAVAMFKGEFFQKDEEILEKFPHSQRAREIEEQRRSGMYSMYIPRKSRAAYQQKYSNPPNATTVVSVDEDKEGGEK